MSSMNEDDRLSMFPEEIVSQILSLMPTKYAVRTSVLSKRWRYSWMYVTNLDFDDYHPFLGNKFLVSFVDSVMSACESSQIKLFRLHFPVKRVARSSVSSWIEKALMLNVPELDIQVIRPNLPLSLFTCKTLTKLKIHDEGRGIRDRDWECPHSVNLPCLKTLDIAVLTNPFVNAFILISGCPMLESLSLQILSRSDDEDYIFNIPTLKLLKLRLGVCVPRINKVFLKVPNLEYLSVGGHLGSLFVMEDLPSLVKASISIDSKRYDHLLVELLKTINKVETLSLEEFLRSPITTAMPIFPNMRHLEFKSCWGSWGPVLILQFLEMCPNLKSLCVGKLIHEDWIEPSVPACMLTSLTSIKFSNYTEHKSEMQFLGYMLKNAEVLKTLTIYWGNNDIEDENEKRPCAELLELQRASRDCEICFIGN